jgi:Tfp pilus tip-associated adhesin PilY1
MRLPTGPRKAAYKQVTMMTKNKAGKRVLKPTDLDNPIRTIVIGIVASENDPQVKKNPQILSEVRRMRLNLVRAAVAGQGGDASKVNYGNMNDAPFQPFFADNVATLTTALQSALSFVNESQAQQPGLGSMTESVPLGGEDAASNMFKTTYRIVDGNQWDAALTRYVVSKDKKGISLMRADWELGAQLLAKRGGGGTPAKSRNLRYWGLGGGRFQFIPLAEDDSNFARLAGMTDKRMNADNLTNKTFGGYAPHRALYQWLQGYDYSYARKSKFPRSSMLADTSQSGIVFVDDPAPADSLPGYKAWAERIKNNNPHPARLYLQTNDGILHVINPADGDEEMAVLPPPVLLPSRLATLKTRAAAGGLQWMEVDGPEKTTPGFRSNPAYLLDGSLQRKRLDMSSAADGSGWGTYLLGTLGRGGGGLYMLDVSAPGDPKFLWYLERAVENLISMSSNDGEPHVTALKDITAPAWSPYKKLGYNSPRPAVGAAGDPVGGHPGIIVLPGGTQSAINFDDNGGEGATLLLIDPRDGSVIRAFDSEAAGLGIYKLGQSVKGRAPYMGMMTSEPTLYRSSISPYLTGSVFAADNRGNIFRVRLEEKLADGRTKPLSSGSWTILPIATLQPSDSAAKTSDSNYSVPYGMIAASAVSSVWLAGGTSDVKTAKTQGLPTGIIQNESQMIFSLDASDDGPPFARDKLKRLSADDTTGLLASEKHYKGWYIPLKEDGQNRFREYVSAKPALSRGILFVPTFIQKNKINTADTSVCGLTRNVNGSSRLYAVDVLTGAPVLWKGAKGASRFIEMNGVKLTGLTQVKKDGTETLLLTYDSLDGQFNPNGAGQDKHLRGVPGADSAAEVYGLPAASGNTPLSNGASVIDYWLIK